MYSCAYSAGLSGIEGYTVTVECNSVKSENEMTEIIGLPDAAVKEAKERVKTACLNSGYRFPEGMLTVNLAPADQKKEGSAFDMAIFVSVLRNEGIIRKEVDLSKKCFAGELSLSGDIRGIKGILCRCVSARNNGFREFYAPAVNGLEASVVSGITVYAVENVRQLVEHLNGSHPMSPLPCRAQETFEEDSTKYLYDFSDVRGQYMVKRAMEIAAVGGHNVLLIGPPGTGKSMLAQRLPTIMPPLSFEEAIETTKIYSVSGLLPEDKPLITTRPFRTPHHTATEMSLVGGGTIPKPGEISLANNGVLFLDEFPEFNKKTLDSLRQPLEERNIVITRSNGRVAYPCSFMLVAAMNPCRCGHYGDPTQSCRCKDADRIKYLSKISGPMLDRFDIQVECARVTFDQISGKEQAGETSAVIRERVIKAREYSLARIEETERKERNIYTNAQYDPAMIHKYCVTDDEALSFMKNAFEKLGLSARGYDRILRLSRTIADMDFSEKIQKRHIAEAIQYRSLERKYWGKNG